VDGWLLGEAVSGTEMAGLFVGDGDGMAVGLPVGETEG